MPLPDSFLQELIARNDMESVASSYVTLRRRGRNLVGLCPFHGEKTPSSTVYPETASFYCFGCGAGGDVITFIKKIENLDYIDAVKLLADRAGMKMPENDINDATSRLRTRILEANREAARLFHAWLYAPEGKVGLEYFHNRGYTDATIRHFGLGYAPDSFRMLRDALRQKGFKDEELVAAFLEKRSTRPGSSGNLFDIFRGRVMIPIIDIRGNVIAFGGRVLDDSKPKYLNSSDTLAFKKTDNLFALNFAKAANNRTLILCEGYMDVIALHQAGFTNAVAALGTSFTANHAHLVSRYADEAVLIFDADAAGQKGTQRAINLLRGTGVNIRVVTIPDGKDPDEFIKKNGPERFRLLLERAANDVEYRLIELGQRHMLGTSDGRVGYLREAAELLAGLASPIERDVYAGKLATELSVSKDAILQQVNYSLQKKRKQQKDRQLSQIVRNTENTMRRVNPEADKHVRAVSAEEGLIGLLLLHPDFIRPVAESLPPERMATTFNRRLYQLLIDRQKNGLLVELSFLSADYNEEEMAYISRMVRDARDRETSLAEAQRYAEILREEYRLRGLEDPAALPEEKIHEVLAAMRDLKK